MKKPNNLIPMTKNTAEPKAPAPTEAPSAPAQQPVTIEGMVQAFHTYARRINSDLVKMGEIADALGAENIARQKTIDEKAAA